MQNKRHALICDISESASKLKLASVRDVKRDVLCDIRKNEPIEAWREAERKQQSDLYNAKREISEQISNGTPKMQLANKRKQVDLKTELVKEVRAKSQQPLQRVLF